MKSAWLQMGSASLISAGLYLSAQFGSIGTLVLALMAPLPLYLVGLSMGARAVSISGAAAAMVVIAVTSGIGAVVYICTHVAPAFLISWKAALSQQTTGPSGATTRQWYPAGLLISWLVAPQIAMLAFVFGLGLTNGEGFRALVAGHMEPLLQVIRSAPQETLPTLAEKPSPEQMAAIENLIVHFAPVTIALVGMLTSLANASLAQGLLTRFGRNIRPTPRMSEIVLPRSLILAFAICLPVHFLIGGDIGFLAITIAGILSFPIFISGLGVAHSLAERSKSPFAILFMTYAMLMIAGYVMMLIMTAVGLIDHFAGLKARFRAGSSQT
jgi:uncharacterized protein YybS (DUF2232 family)